MPMGGRRRVRFLLSLLVFIVLGIVYFRRAQVEDYSDYVTDKVVGGGAVLRPGNKAQEAPRPTPRPTRPQEDALAAVGEDGKEAGHAPLVTSLSSSSSVGRTTSIAAPGAASTSSSSIPVGNGSPTVPNTAPGHKAIHGLPPIPHDDYLADGYEGQASSSSTSAVHWSKQTEHFPIATTIQLPTAYPKALPRIQVAGKNAGKADKERLALIRAAAAHAWDGYRRQAWGMDELRPISGGVHNPFNKWGATLVDSLDTLWIMDMKAEFEEAVERVAEIDFTTSVRPDIPLFETTIRYLGGLVAAYDVSGGKYRILLDKAVELAEVLYGAFDTPNRMPQTFYRWKPAFASQPKRASNHIVMAELGSLSLEFTRLSQLTGEPKYYDAIARITDAFQEWQNNTRLPGLWPTSLDASGCEKPVSGGYRAPSNQMPIPGGSGEIMDAGTPVQANRAWAGSAEYSTGQSVDQKQHEAAQKKLDEQNAAEQPGSSKAKRQLVADTKIGRPSGETDRSRHMPSSTQPEHSKARLNLDVNDATELVDKRPQPAKPAPPVDTRTGQEVCLPQGLASTSPRGSETFSLGGQADSTFEYLPKEYMLLGGVLEQYKDMYIAVADAAIQELLFQPMTVDARDILFAGTKVTSINAAEDNIIKTLKPDGEHLACFTGGMFAMGGKLFDRPEDVEIGRRLTDGCVWAYRSTTTGIMPETFSLIDCGNDWRGGEECVWNQTEYWRQLDPYEESRTKIYVHPVPTSISIGAATASTTGVAGARKTDAAALDQLSENYKAGTVDAEDIASVKDDAGALHVMQKLAVGPDEFQEVGVDLQMDRSQRHNKRQLPQRGTIAADSTLTASSGALRSMASMKGLNPTTVAGPLAYTPKPPLSHEEYVRNKIEDERLPSGFVRIRSRTYILRPEAIESVWYMYRITGESYWRDVGWDMFVAIDQSTRTLYGNGAIDDVTKMSPEIKDSMESFWLAETLKYFYLLFEDAEKWSLDEWVLNTEAHFFKRPKA